MDNLASEFITELNPDTLHPAYLYVGQQDATLALAISFMQQILCNNQGCHVCMTCRNIQEGQHHAITWLTSDKSYTRESIQDIFDTLAFALEPGTHHFIVIQHTELLTPASANSLLKSLEEPPAGYHFILLANRSESLLPTIRSRCVTQHHQSISSCEDHPLAIFLSSTLHVDPLVFLQELENCEITEQESSVLLDTLLIHWSNEYKKQLLANNAEGQKSSLRVIHILQSALLTSPMPGSSKLFWKNIFLQIKQHFMI